MNTNNVSFKSADNMDTFIDGIKIKFASAFASIANFFPPNIANISPTRSGITPEQHREIEQRCILVRDAIDPEGFCGKTNDEGVADILSKADNDELSPEEKLKLLECADRVVSEDALTKLEEIVRFHASITDTKFGRSLNFTLYKEFAFSAKNFIERARLNREKLNSKSQQSRAMAAFEIFGTEHSDSLCFTFQLLNCSYSMLGQVPTNP